MVVAPADHNRCKSRRVEMDKKVPENILRVSGIDTLQGILQSKNIDLIKQVQQLETALAAARERERALESEKEGCKETAAQHLRNEDYYRGLVQGIGNNFGADAYISEDGSIQQDILCAKVPYLVMQMNERLWELESDFAIAKERERVLREALENLLYRYVELIKSGDCGNWNPEEELQVIKARAALERKEW